MKFGQLIELKVRNIFLQESYRKWAGRLVPDHFQKQVVDTVILIYFGSPRLEHTIKANCTKLQNVDPEIGTNLIF